MSDSPQSLAQFRERLPRPLAQGLSQVERQSGQDRESEALWKFVELIVRYSCLVDLAVYTTARPGATKDDVLERSLGGFAKPGFGEWLRYARELQAGLDRAELASTLPPLSRRLGDPSIVEFTSRVTGSKSPEPRLSQFLDAVIQWRNTHVHASGVQRRLPETDLLSAGLPAVLNICTRLQSHMPVWIESAEVQPGPSLRVRLFRAVGTADPMVSSQTLPYEWALPARTLWLWGGDDKDRAELAPFLRWDEGELMLLEAIRHGQPNYTSPSGRVFAPPDPLSDLRSRAAFLVEQASPTTPRERMLLPPPSDALREFRTCVEFAAEQGELSAADRQMLEKRRLRSGISEADAAAILAEYLGRDTSATGDSATVSKVAPGASDAVAAPPPLDASESRWSHLLSLPLDTTRATRLFYSGAPQ